MDFNEVMRTLEELGTDKTKKYYMNQGAEEPLFGTATGAMKPMAKAIKKNQALAETLFETGNFDAMYFAGIIADPKIMTEADFHRWVSKAYFYMISDFIVAVTLSESPLAMNVADQFIDSGVELTMSAGWSCYEWLLGSQKDSYFEVAKIESLLENVEKTIHTQPNRTKYAMNRFLVAVGISFAPLSEKAILVSRRIGEVTVEKQGKMEALTRADLTIEKALEKGRLGSKRKYVRC